MTGITTHILDLSIGMPADRVPVTLYHESKSGRRKIASGKTNSDGRIPDLTRGIALSKGTYKLVFETAVYFRRKKKKSFYPFVEITFTIDAIRHYHVPLLLSPFGYSTYRGS